VSLAYRSRHPQGWLSILEFKTATGVRGRIQRYTGGLIVMSQPATISNDPASSYPQLVVAYGFLPNLFRVQNAIPDAIEAEQRLIDALLVRQNSLGRNQKDAILNGVATVRGSDYCRALFGHSRAPVPDNISELLDFSLKLAKHGPWVSGSDVLTLKNSGFDETAILEAIVTTGIGVMLCTLADGLCPRLDTELRPPAPVELLNVPEPLDWPKPSGEHLSLPPDSGTDSRAYVVLREQFGFVPNLYRLQNTLPEVLDAEVRLLEAVLFAEGGLNRVQKECILLAVSAANLNTYCATLHSQVLSILGIPLEESDRIVKDHRTSALSAIDRVLLDETRKLASLPGRSSQRFETERLCTQGFTELQVVEAVVVSGLANLLNTVQAGIGAVSDFPPRKVFGPKDLYPLSDDSRLILNATVPEDPDAILVARVQSGNIDGFEELVRRHSRRIFGTLAGLLGNVDDAHDATQDVFLKAFENIGRFQGRSKFSTWLTSIAIHAGTDLLRQRKPSEPLEEDEGFRPRQIQKWADDPERLLAASQMNELIREAVLRLPEKYRIAVLLRDINQLSTEEAAAALDLSVPALKARVLRGRLMLRESLAPHFVRQDKIGQDKTDA
jgi:RNA polymerase sigma-70 factor, ECF subfamily